MKKWLIVVLACGLVEISAFFLIALNGFECSFEVSGAKTLSTQRTQQTSVDPTFTLDVCIFKNAKLFT